MGGGKAGGGGDGRGGGNCCIEEILVEKPDSFREPEDISIKMKRNVSISAIEYNAATPTLLPLHVATAGKNHLNEEITPPPSHWDRRTALPNHIKFRTYSALALM